MEKSSVFIIGIAGGSGSGKTTVSEILLRALPNDASLFIQHDFYYRDMPHLSYEERCRLNYDYPDALETSLLIEHLDALRAGQAVALPQYDFTTHLRKHVTLHAAPKPVIVVDGILIFADDALRSRFDLNVFVDADDDVRALRRLRRDLVERGRSVESVFDQYLTTVKPMYDRFVAPTKEGVDVVIVNNDATLDQLAREIESIVRRIPSF